jgi:hypothetical protein
MAEGAAPVTPAAGVAGASARRMYERRAGRERPEQEQAVQKDAAWRRQQLVADRPVLGQLATALTPKPEVRESQSTRAWAEGATGEEVVAGHLATLPDTVKVLHDRRVPGSKANIDHIAVTPLRRVCRGCEELHRPA